MRYDEIINIVKKRNVKKILIFGPPRSGTTLASLIFAKELDLLLIPEDIGTNMIEEQAINTITNKEAVFHANNAIFYFHSIKDPTVIKIMLNRNEKESISSAERVGILNSVNTFYSQLGSGNNYVENYHLFWNNHKDSNSYLLDYDSLKSTKYWLSKKDRKSFEIKQVTKENIIVLEEFGKEYFEQHLKYLSKPDRKRFGNLRKK